MASLALEPTLGELALRVGRVLSAERAQALPLRRAQVRWELGIDVALRSVEIWVAIALLHLGVNDDGALTRAAAFAVAKLG